MRKPRPSVEKRAWETMRGRCLNRSDKDFHLYGGRGIKVCARWLASVDAFIADMGLKPSPRHQLDRMDNNGNYEPGNCRWVTPAQQAQNRRTSKLCALSAVLIRYMRRRGASCKHLGHAFGVAAETASKITRNKIWNDALPTLSCASLQGCGGA